MTGQNLSPCVKLCKLELGVCRGCGRTLNEIRHWSTSTQAEQQTVRLAKERIAFEKIQERISEEVFCTNSRPKFITVTQSEWRILQAGNLDFHGKKASECTAAGIPMRISE